MRWSSSSFIEPPIYAVTEPTQRKCQNWGRVCSRATASVARWMRDNPYRIGLGRSTGYWCRLSSEKRGSNRQALLFGGAVVVTSHGYGSDFGHRQAGQGATGRGWSTKLHSHGAVTAVQRQKSRVSREERERGEPKKALGQFLGGLTSLRHKSPPQFLQMFWVRFISLGPICFWGLLLLFFLAQIT